MNFDPTQNRILHGMLTEEEQKVIETWPHGHQYWDYYRKGWCDTSDPSWDKGRIFRAKPAPVVTSVWANLHSGHVFGGFHSSRKAADDHSLTIIRQRVAVLRIDTINGVTTAHLEGL